MSRILIPLAWILISSGIYATQAPYTGPYLISPRNNKLFFNPENKGPKTTNTHLPQFVSTRDKMSRLHSKDGEKPFKNAPFLVKNMGSIKNLPKERTHNTPLRRSIIPLIRLPEDIFKIREIKKRQAPTFFPKDDKMIVIDHETHKRYELTFQEIENMRHNMLFCTSQLLVCFEALIFSHPSFFKFVSLWKNENYIDEDHANWLLHLEGTFNKIESYRKLLKTEKKSPLINKLLINWFVKLREIRDQGVNEVNSFEFFLNEA